MSHRVSFNKNRNLSPQHFNIPMTAPSLAHSSYLSQDRRQLRRLDSNRLSSKRPCVQQAGARERVSPHPTSEGWVNENRSPSTEQCHSSSPQPDSSFVVYRSSPLQNATQRTASEHTTSSDCGEARSKANAWVWRRGDASWEKDPALDGVQRGRENHCSARTCTSQASERRDESVGLCHRCNTLHSLEHVEQLRIGHSIWSRWLVDLACRQPGHHTTTAKANASEVRTSCWRRRGSKVNWADLTQWTCESLNFRRSWPPNNRVVSSIISASSVIFLHHRTHTTLTERTKVAGQATAPPAQCGGRLGAGDHHWDGRSSVAVGLARVGTTLKLEAARSTPSARVSSSDAKPVQPCLTLVCCRSLLSDYDTVQKDHFCGSL